MLDIQHCCLCGLVCANSQLPVPTAEPPPNAGAEGALEPFASVCPKVAQWRQQNRRDAFADGRAWVGADVVWDIVTRLRTCSRTLFWVDAADVACMREIVDLTREIEATIRVGDSTGGKIAKRLLINEGWLGTTLPEVSEHAELVVTLGDAVLRENPLLIGRFLSRSTTARPLEWWHIAEDRQCVDQWTAASGYPAAGSSPQVLLWPRTQWLANLTQLLIALHRRPDAPQPADSTSTSTSESTSESASQPADRRVESCIASLAHRLIQSNNSVWMWQNSEMASELDELLISRMHAVSRELSRTTRCSLLNLESNIGQLTAEECLLWLTGCSGHATWDGARWHQPARYERYLLDDWEREFDNILMVRSSPACSPLPSLEADGLIAGLGDCEAQPHDATDRYPIALTGTTSPGYFFRGDRGALLPIGHRTANRLPTAAELLRSCNRQLQRELYGC